MLFCSVNGEVTNRVLVSDRAFAYGDGIFTTAKIVNGKVSQLEQHINRLINSCERLSISKVSFDELREQLRETAKHFDLAVLKVIITAGQGGRGYSRVGIESPTIVISVHDFPKHYLGWQKEGITVGDSKMNIGINPLLAGLKHLNRLEQVLIRKELDQSSYDDMLVFDINEYLIEASSANVFWKTKGKWYTPNVVNSGIAGLCRAAVLKSNPEIEVVAVEKKNLVDINAMFVCNSVMGIVPIKRYNDQKLSIFEVIDIQNSVES